MRDSKCTESSRNKPVTFTMGYYMFTEFMIHEYGLVKFGSLRGFATHLMEHEKPSMYNSFTTV
jgi:hypothetical protein